MWSIW
jgi:hypothetical protein